MKTEFKDVAHLHIGCRLECSQVFYPKKNSKDKDGNLILSPSLLADFHEKTFSIGDFKPILRPLSDMTVSEARMLINESSFYSQHGISNIEIFKNWQIFFDVQYEHKRRKWRKNIPVRGETPEQFSLLLSKGFDLFGLIESGQAIDATLSLTTGNNNEA